LLFECVRELLFNAIKHSGVTEAEVFLRRTADERVKLVVRDEGRGFDPETVQERDAGAVSFGLFSIRERLAYLGGTMDVQSTIAEGTQILLTAPIGQVVQGREGRASPEPGEPSAATARIPRDGDLIRVLIVDDHKIMREGLKGLLDFQSDIEAVGEAADGPQAIELAETLKPDAIIMDVNLGEMNGMEATRQILSRDPNIAIIGLSMHNDADVAEAMRAAGARAYMTKGGPQSLMQKGHKASQ